MYFVDILNGSDVTMHQTIAHGNII